MTILTSRSAILDSGFALPWLVVVNVAGFVVDVVDCMAVVVGMVVAYGVAVV